MKLFCAFFVISIFIDEISSKTCPCGQVPIKKRIAKGNEAEKHAYPWAVRIMTIKGEGLEGCGGAIIRRNVVVTAAHCLPDNYRPQDMFVFPGYHKAPTPSDLKYSVSRYVHHPGYYDNMMGMKPTIVNDIALLELGTMLNYSKTVQPICLNTDTTDYAGQKLPFVGWGKRNERESQSAALMKGDLTVVDPKACLLGFQNNETLLKDVLCTKDTGGTMACQGDSGGPLMVEKEGLMYLAGVLSTASQCDADLAMNTFMRVSKYVDWMFNTVGIAPDDQC